MPVTRRQVLLWLLIFVIGLAVGHFMEHRIVSEVRIVCEPVGRVL